VPEEGRVREDEVGPRPGEGEGVTAGDPGVGPEQGEACPGGADGERGEVDAVQALARAGGEGEPRRRGEERAAAAGGVEHGEAVEGAGEASVASAQEEEPDAVGRRRASAPSGGVREAEGGEGPGLRLRREDGPARAIQGAGGDRLEQAPVDAVRVGIELAPHRMPAERAPPLAAEAARRGGELGPGRQVRERGEGVGWAHTGDL
jgi:hypothetical protein